eukprot:13580266-Alexandrium_andersonii.AAC.1
MPGVSIALLSQQLLAARRLDEIARNQSHPSGVSQRAEQGYAPAPDALQRREGHVRVVALPVVEGRSAQLGDERRAQCGL